MVEGNRDYHPSPAELDRFLLGMMSPREAAHVLAHLVHGCGRCQRHMAPLATTMFGKGLQIPEPAPESGVEYDFTLFKAFATARRYAGTLTRANASDDQRVPVQVLRAIPVAVTSNELADRDLARCQRLIGQCRALRHSDPETMVLTAALAVAFAERIDLGPERIAELADLQASALAELGNARRVADDLVGAEADLSCALARAAQGAGDPLFLARLMDLTASLYSDQRRFDEARLLLDAVYAIYENAGDRHSAGRALISKGIAANYAFDIEDALLLLSRGLGMVDASREPKLVMIGIHSLIWSLVECGQGLRAAQLFEHSRQLFSTYVERLDAVKTGWLEGRIAAAIGDDERAEQRFREARKSFEEIHLHYEVALVSLDTAALWLRQGRTAEITSLIEETVSILRARGIRREAIGMLLVVREACQQDRVTEAMLRAAAIQLPRLARRGHNASS
jgi:hypothetical protein